MRYFSRLLCATVIACELASAALAQDYPRKPITIVASAAPGGGVDPFGGIGDGAGFTIIARIRPPDE